MRKAAIIVAGGSGTRMGSAVPKQFLEVAGLPIIFHSIIAFAEADPGIRFIIVLPEEHLSRWPLLCKKYDFEMPCMLVAGGATRYESVKNGLSALHDEELVAIHDAVRPMVTPELINACYNAAAVHGAIIPVVKLVDSIREVIDAASVAADRDRFRIVQTPQVFKTAVVVKSYEQPFNDSFTDDATVVEAAGNIITLVEGQRENIKVTTPFDLAIAEAALRYKQR